MTRLSEGAVPSSSITRPDRKMGCCMVGDGLVGCPGVVGFLVVVGLLPGAVPPVPGLPEGGGVVAPPLPCPKAACASKAAANRMLAWKKCGRDTRAPPFDRYYYPMRQKREMYGSCAHGIITAKGGTCLHPGAV